MHESAGKKKGTGGSKIGNAHLKWAFSEAACLLVRRCPKAKTWLARRKKKHGKKRALGAWPPGWGARSITCGARQEAFDVTKFLAS